MNRKITPLLAILVIAIAVMWIYRSQSGRPRKFDLNPYQALGAGVAEETAKLLGGNGSVALITEDTTPVSNPALDGQLQAFLAAIKKLKSMPIAATVKFKLTPLDRMASGGSVSRDQFLQTLQAHPNLGAVVLFCGFPLLAAEDYNTLKQSGTKVVVASGYMPAYKRLVEARIIHLLVVPKFDRLATPAAPARAPRSLRDWFEQEFLVVTPANTASLPY